MTTLLARADPAVAGHNMHPATDDITAYPPTGPARARRWAACSASLASSAVISSAVDS